jgi:hypothetical protein
VTAKMSCNSLSNGQNDQSDGLLYIDYGNRQICQIPCRRTNCVLSSEYPSSRSGHSEASAPVDPHLNREPLPFATVSSTLKLMLP